MKKRLIGGSGYVLLTYLSFYLNVYVIMITLFLIVGIYEFYKIFKTNNKITKYFIIYFIVFILGIFSLNYIDMHIGSMYLVILTTAIMLFDTAAYFSGKRFGKTKITSISPNKTYEGIIGGMIVSLFTFFIYIILIDKKYILTIFGSLNIFISILIMFLILICSFLGDILESRLKREYKIKDSGTFVYGHGGILDRIDSLLFSAIIYFLILFMYLH